ncbi:MAG: copper chaperone [Actinomycetota bacterium]
MGAGSLGRPGPTAEYYVWAGSALSVAALGMHHWSAGIAPGSWHGSLDMAGMMAAMMTALAGESAAEVSGRTLRRHRWWSVTVHALAFGSVWFAFSIAVVALVAFAALLAPMPVLFSLLAGGAAAWQLSPARSALVQRCTRIRTAPPGGWQAPVGLAVGGADQAVRCLGTCWASMLAMAAAPHPALTAAVFAAGFYEWAPGRDPFDRIRRLRPVPVYLALAAGVLAGALLG